jgi:hypothetical protein
MTHANKIRLPLDLNTIEFLSRIDESILHELHPSLLPSFISTTQAGA